MEKKRVPLAAHLEELRRRFIYSLFAWLSFFIICFIYQNRIMEYICYPHFNTMQKLNLPITLKILRYQESFLAYFKVTLVASLLLVMPFVLSQVWKFISVGLYPHERKHVTTYAPFSFMLFLLGVAFGYFVFIPMMLKFLASYGDKNHVELVLTLNGYLNLFIILTMVLGIMFELPLVMVFLSVTGLVHPNWFAKNRKLAIIIAFILAAIITPTGDPVNQILLAIPLIILYETGIIISRLKYK